MAIAAWWRGDARPALEPLAGFAARPVTDAGLISAANGIEPGEALRRFAAGHRAYVGFADEAPATYGWVATREVSLGELAIERILPAGDRYLWDFGTLPAFRGRGLYPRLLDAILQGEHDASRFWIVYAPENEPSGVGIARAGFATVAELSHTADARVGLLAGEAADRARVASEVFGVPMVDDALTSCWRCASHEGCGCSAGGDGACACRIAPGWSPIAVQP